MIRIGVLVLSLLLAIGDLAAPVENSDEFWSEWSEATFARAAREHKFVVISLLQMVPRHEPGDLVESGSTRHPGLCRSG